jgi:anti-sigma factor (TIGR02949 family)
MWSGSEALSEISCEEVLSEIEHFLHGELDQNRSSQLADHLSTCTPCFYRAEFQRRLKEIIRAKCRSEAPSHLEVKVRQVIRSIEIVEGDDSPGSV